MNSEGRYEVKFVLDENQMTEALRWLHVNTPMRKSYPSREVHSLYLDDNEFQSVKDNLAGVAKRVKTRLRWYHMEGEVSIPSLEQKIRDGRLGYKKSIQVPNLKYDFEDLNISKVVAAVRREVGNTEAGCNLFDRNLSPTLYVRYEREYYEGNEGIRLTFDKNIMFGYIVPSKSLRTLSLVPYPYYVMEIKFVAEQKDRVSDLIRGLYLTPRRHSKYLVGLAIFGQVTYI